MEGTDMKALLALAVAMGLSGCEFARNADTRLTDTLDRSNILKGTDAVADAIAVQCATLDDIIVRLAVDSVARLTGNTRHIDRLRAERRRVCAEAEATRQRVTAIEKAPDGTTPTP